ncbi:MAG TPA: trypsin-like peptidase domain-containing protein [Ktedonobacterales bacterium]|nr:trypsin-like peptidase domain-containing protein [Ktedonobacterales bacterium]
MQPYVPQNTPDSQPEQPQEPREPQASQAPQEPQVPQEETTGAFPQNSYPYYGAITPVPPTAPVYPQYPMTPMPPSRPPRKRAIIPLSIGIVLVGFIAMFVAGCAIGANSASNNASQNNGSTGAAPTVAVPASATDLQQNVVNVVHTVQPSVVEVTSQGGQGEAIGSGEILTADGYIVTNDHVVDGFSQFSVNLSSGKSLPAQLIGQDPQDDLAVLKVSASNLQPIAFADSAKVQVGQFAIALGSPLGLQQSATFGIVSALNRSASEAPDGPAGELTGLIQTSAPINPGNSGGALVDLSGKLIGIPTLGATDPNSGGTANGIGFAIPSDRVKFVADQLMKNGHLVSTGQGFLGVSGEDVTPQLAAAYNLPAQSGVLVTGFANDTAGASPAQKAGIQNGDIITAVNGQSVTNNGDLAGALLNLSPGTQVTLTIQRSSGQQQVKVTLGERPTNLQG